MGERELCLAAVRARLQRVESARDLSPVLEEAAIDEAYALARLLPPNGQQLDSSELEALVSLAWLHFYRYQALPEGKDEFDRDAAFTMFSYCFMAGLSSPNLPEPLLPVLARRASLQAAELLTRAVQADDPDFLDGVLQLWHHILPAATTRTAPTT